MADPQQNLPPLPPGFTADPLPKGWTMDQPAEAAPPPAPFMTRFNKRMAGNIRSMADLPAMARDVTQAIERSKTRPYVPGQGLKEIWDSLKQTYSDPANAVADIAGAALAHQAGGGEAAPPVQEKPSGGMPWWSKRRPTGTYRRVPHSQCCSEQGAVCGATFLG